MSNLELILQTKLLHEYSVIHPPPLLSSLAAPLCYFYVMTTTASMLEPGICHQPLVDQIFHQTQQDAQFGPNGADFHLLGHKHACLVYIYAICPTKCKR